MEAKVWVVTRSFHNAPGCPWRNRGLPSDAITPEFGARA
jgi:hypothetical protein